MRIVIIVILIYAVGYLGVQNIQLRENLRITQSILDLKKDYHEVQIHKHWRKK